MNHKPAQRSYYPQFRSLLTWPQETFRLLLAIPLLVAFLLFCLHWFTASRHKQFAQQATSRLLQLQTAKLSGAPPYFWKPLLDCQGAQGDLTATNNYRCLPLHLKLVPANEIRPNTENFQLSEPMSGPCLACHQQAINSVVVYEFSEKAPWHLPLQYTIGIAFAFAIVWLAGWVWFYFKRRVFLREPLVAVALVSPRGFTAEWQITRILFQKQRQNYLYLEWGANYSRGIMSLRQFENWLDSLAAGLRQPSAGTIPDASVKIAAYLAQHPGGLPIPFESLRRAHLMAHRGIAGNLLVEKQLLDKITSPGIPRSQKKAFWKTKQGEVTEFGILSLILNQPPQQTWSPNHA